MRNGGLRTGCLRDVSEQAYISLYGLSSAEDFYHRVFCGINSWAQNGFVGFVGTGVTKVAKAKRGFYWGAEGYSYSVDVVEGE